MAEQNRAVESGSENELGSENGWNREAVIAAHPLLETFERTRARSEYMQMLKLRPENGLEDAQEGSEWYSLQTLLSSADEPVRRMMDRIGLNFKTENSRVKASFFFGEAAYVLLALANVCYLMDRRVPQWSPDTLWFSFGEDGYMNGIALNEYRFAALADDPAAAHADCMILASEDELQEFLISQTTTALQPLTQVVRSHSKLGLPAMWALAADYASSSAIYVGREMNQAGRALDLARQISIRPSRLQRKRGFFHIEESGLSYDMIDRTSCCLYYEVEGGHYCSSCPHRPQEERVDLIKKWLAETAAGEAESH